MAGSGRLGVRMGRVTRTIAPIAIAAVGALASANVSAQTLNDALNNRARGGDSRLLVEARDIVYDNDKNTVSAVGNVELYYQGRVLQADRVIYDRKTQRVTAIGNARLTEADGTIVTGDRFELSEDFKNGFINSLRLRQTGPQDGKIVTTRFTAPRAERTNGETTVFEAGTYTACEPCAKDPERPPLWQVKAARIIHNNTERTIYYENARLEFAGVPIAYVPYFSTPDPTVKRKTGFLSPRYIANTALGYGVSTPFFWNLAPNYDLTVTPTFLSRQGFLGQVEWRHRLSNGFYNVRAAGIFQQDKEAFLPAPYGAREKTFRGSIETTGRFAINDKWNFGWDVATVTDKWFLQNYRVRSESLSSTYIKESISQVYLTGRGESGFFDLRSYYFKPLSYYDWQKQQPLVHPVLDYNKRFRHLGGIGGEVAFDFNFTSLSRDAAQFQQIPTQQLSLFNFSLPGNRNYNIFETCAVFQRGQCLVRGVGGSVSRATAQVSWRRDFIDPLGQVWQPFAFMRTDGIWQSPNTSRYQNANVANFIDTDADFFGRAMPGVGVTYKFPFVARTETWGTHIFEPVAQIIARPNETRIGRLPNEDAQSLVFDDTNIFEWDKFSGYDRVEGGVRANYGAQYTVTTDHGAYANLLFGQSYHLSGRNSFSKGDLANTGLDSGLETRRSDYVGRFRFAPNKNLAFTARGRFDEQDFNLRRIELQATGVVGPLSTSVIYARYDAQPQLGIGQRREGVLASGTLKLNDNWYVNGNVLVDLDQYLTDRTQWIATGQVGNKPDRFTVSTLGLGFGYTDECTTLQVVYTANFKNATTGTRQRDQTIMLRLELTTLGQATVTQNVSGTSSQDGISQ